VAEGLVVGIFSGSDAKTLESALTAQQIDVSKVKVVGGRAEDPDDTKLEFVDVIAEMESNSRADEMTKGLGIMGDSGGTSVPGIGGRQTTLESFTHRESAHQRYFSGFNIPTDEVDNFSDAVADGRSVVLYLGAGSDAQAIATAFRAAGLRNVRSY
jgi:rhodanese-related sulfurtransferase